MRLGITGGSLILVMFISSCSNRLLQSDSVDCGFSATYSVPEPGSEAKITISRVQAGDLNGKTKCDSAYAPARVDKAFVDGKEMQEMTLDGVVIYMAPMGFDPASDPISIDVGGRGYITDQNNVRRVDDRYVIGLRPFPPK